MFVEPERAVMFVPSLNRISNVSQTSDRGTMSLIGWDWSSVCGRNARLPKRPKNINLRP
jgi:hypothetical protein